MLQAANTDLFNQLVTMLTIVCQILPYTIQIKPVKVNLKFIGRYLYFAPILG